MSFSTARTFSTVPKNEYNIAQAVSETPSKIIYFLNPIFDALKCHKNVFYVAQVTSGERLSVVMRSLASASTYLPDGLWLYAEPKTRHSYKAQVDIEKGTTICANRFKKSLVSKRGFLTHQPTVHLLNKAEKMRRTDASQYLKSWFQDGVFPKMLDPITDWLFSLSESVR